MKTYLFDVKCYVSLNMKKVSAKAFQRQFFALLPVYINVFMMGCTLGWLANAVYFFNNGNEVSATPSQLFWITSCSELGRLAFAIPAGLLVDKFGRKTIISCCGILHFMSWSTMSLNSSVVVIYIIRFTLGIATALVSATALIYVGEIASPEVRGKLTSVYQIFLVAGAISECVITVLFSSYYMLAYCTTVFSGFHFVSMYWLMETPNYLISVSKLDRAKKNLKRIRPGYSEDDITTEFEKVQKYIEEEQLRKKETSWLDFIKFDNIRKPLITVILLNFFTQANGRNTIIVYATAIYPTGGLVPSQYYPLLGSVIGFAVSVCSAFYIDKFPRRTIYMTGSSLLIIITTFCAIEDYLWIQNDDVVSKYLFLYGNILIGIVHFGTVQPMCSALKSEILPQAVKGFGGSLGVIAQTVASTISYQLYYLISEHFYLYYLYLIFSIDSLILCILVYLRLPECRGKALADLQMNVQDKTSSGENV